MTPVQFATPACKTFTSPSTPASPCQRTEACLRDIALVLKLTDRVREAMDRRASVATH